MQKYPQISVIVELLNTKGISGISQVSLEAHVNDRSTPISLEKLREAHSLVEYETDDEIIGTIEFMLQCEIEEFENATA